MSSGSSPSLSPRADAVRNRAALLWAAGELFREAGDAPVPLEAIARTAGVGIGTLYRHFPTRDALVAAVYAGELDDLAAAAEHLVAAHRGSVALRLWIARYADFVAAKRGMRDALGGSRAEEGALIGDTRERITAAVETVLAAGRADASLRADARADDVTAALIGVFLATARSGDGDAGQRDRLFELVLAGLRP